MTDSLVCNFTVANASFLLFKVSVSNHYLPFTLFTPRLLLSIWPGGVYPFQGHTQISMHEYCIKVVTKMKQ